MTDRWGATIGGLMFWAAIMTGIVIVGIAVFSVVPAHAEWKNVAAEWDQYRLNDSQRGWFKSIKNKQNVPCCDIADGHPTEMRRVIVDKESSSSEYQVPDPRPEHMGEWLDVPKTALTTPPNNAVGVATVWYTLNTGFSGAEVYIRCFVPDSEG
jgi:hypothetical protein